MNFDLTDEQITFQKALRQFSDSEIEPLAREIEEKDKLPDELIAKMARQELFGLAVPKEYGGVDAGALYSAIACEQLAYSGTGAWWLLAFNNSIPETIAHFGNSYIKNTFLKPLCDGTSYASIQFTESDTGSDPKSLTCKIRDDGGSYTVNGTKRFSTFGARPGFAMLFAKDDDGNCSSFVIEKNVQGYNVSKTWQLMGSGGIEAVDVYFENMRVPEQNLLGKKGQGFDILLYWIAIEKIQQCAACVGIAQAALDEAIKYAKSRIIREKPISDMQGIRWMIAEMYAKLQSARWITYRAAYLKERERAGWMTEAAAAKLAVIPAAMEIVEMSRRIHGAYGYTKDFKIERLYRAIAGASAIAVSLEINKSIVGASLLK